MTTAAFADFLYSACLRDWDAEGERDAPNRAIASTQRTRCGVVGVDTDISSRSPAGTAGRRGRAPTCPPARSSDCPVEDSANGADHLRRVPALVRRPPGLGIRFRFEDGRDRRGIGRERRGLLARDTRHRRGCAPARRVRDRLQRRHRPRIRQCSLRREDLRRRSTSRSAPASRSSAAPTRVPSTGTIVKELRNGGEIWPPTANWLQRGRRVAVLTAVGCGVRRAAGDAQSGASNSANQRERSCSIGSSFSSFAFSSSSSALSRSCSLPVGTNGQNAPRLYP